MISDEEYLLLLEKKIETLSQRVTELEARFVEEEDRTTPLWKLFTEEGECRDVLEKHVLTKLNDVDLKLFHFVNKKSRAAIRRAKIQMSEKRFRVEEFHPWRRWKWRGNATRFWRIRKKLRGLCCPLNHTSVVSLRERTISLYSNGRER